jgi:hypothetical protein
LYFFGLDIYIFGVAHVYHMGSRSAL